MYQKRRYSMTDEERIAVSYLPNRLAQAVYQTISRWQVPISEIRLREDGPLTLTIGFPKKNLLCGVVCTSDELRETVEYLCGCSLYSHSGSICEGVIITSEGLRAGIAGRAVLIDGRIECVRDISSVNIRIPHRVEGAADAFYKIVRQHGSTLLISPPGLGKTTMLRELIPLLSQGEEELKTAIIDTRYELGAGMPRDGLADFYPGWPRYDGMIAAVRTMSPDVILCDEIADENDCRAVRAASAAGVTVIASAHGADIATVRRNRNLAALIDEGIFGCVCGIFDGQAGILEG